MVKKSTEHLKKPSITYNHPGRKLKRIEYIEDMPDPRGCYCNFKHPLVSIIFIALLGLILRLSISPQKRESNQAVPAWSDFRAGRPDYSLEETLFYSDFSRTHHWAETG